MATKQNVLNTMATRRNVLNSMPWKRNDLSLTATNRPVLSLKPKKWLGLSLTDTQQLSPSLIATNHPVLSLMAKKWTVLLSPHSKRLALNTIAKNHLALYLVLLLPRKPLQKMHLSKLNLLPSKKMLHSRSNLDKVFTLSATDMLVTIVKASFPVATWLLPVLAKASYLDVPPIVMVLAGVLAVAQALQFTQWCEVLVPAETDFNHSLALHAQHTMVEHRLVLALALAVLASRVECSVLQLHDLVLVVLVSNNNKLLILKSRCLFPAMVLRKVAMASMWTEINMMP